MNRHINLLKLLEKSSHFLWGARGTGKSFLIKKQLGNHCQIIDLLDSALYLRLKAHPEDLAGMIHHSKVVIDEIQRIPELLNDIQKLIEDKGIHFLLTGSSARKLRRQGTNLLAGRALQAWMQPLTWSELTAEQSFDLEKYLLLGGLPKAYLQDVAQEYLFSYVDTYLKEEIHAEALVKNLGNFTRFLEQAAQCSGEILNFTKIGSDAQLSPNTVRDYYQILEDTLVGFQLLPWTKSKKRKAVQTSKFFLFDIGVANAASAVTTLPRASDIYGRAFEHFMVQEVLAFLRYRGKRQSLCFWRSKNQQEVDLVIGDDVAIEFKAARHVTERDHRGLLALAEEKAWKHLIVVSQDTVPMTNRNGIRHLPWSAFLTELWSDQLI